MSPLLVEARAINFHHDGVSILQDIDLRMAAGEIVTLIGPNGAGKTSLVKILLGLLKPSSGKVQRRKGLRIGYMPQRLQIDPSLPITVEAFLKLANNNRQQIDQALAEVNADGLQQRPLQKISGGEMQRVLLARALLRDPELLVLDEPAQGVDINGQNELYALISRLRDRHHCGVLMVSHDLHLVMAKTDTVICLNHHVCCHGHPEQVSNDPAYRELFGDKGAEALAVYHHHHDHQHDIHGDVIGEASCQHEGHHHG
jgi:zinc transport system ATP-binding protein